MQIRGIRCGETPWAQGGIQRRYTVEEKGGAELVPGPETGGLTIDLWTFREWAELAGLSGEDAARFSRPAELTLQCGGWQSWSAGWELGPRETLPRSVRIIPELLKQTNREGDIAPPAIPPGPEAQEAAPQGGIENGRDWLAGHFITYLRAGDCYLCAASREGGESPPVSFRVNRERQLVAAEVFCPGKAWQGGDLLAGITLFYAQGYFPFKDALRTLYRQEEVFAATAFLGSLPGGYESWYNHYTEINEKLILDDLEGLGRTENLIKKWYLDRKKPLGAPVGAPMAAPQVSPVVFQIDDGWEKAVGEWEINLQRFPNGLAPVAAKIEAEGYIPGLWLAPFLVTRRSRIYAERPGWLLRDAAGQPVVAGYNHLWDKQYYCFDLSRKDVLEYLRGIMDRVIDEWGFRYLKLDFLYAGFFSGAFAEGGSPYEHYERACAVLTARTRSASGLPVAYLGCGCPLGPSYRRFPLSRIGADTREVWDWNLIKFLMGHVGRPGAYVNLQDTIGRAYLNGTVYINDPDVIFLRSRNCKLKEQEKELIALVNFLLGGQIMISDDPYLQEPADIVLTRRICALYERLEEDEYGARRLDRDIFRLESRSGRIAGLINLSGRPYTLTASSETASGETAYGGTDASRGGLYDALSRGSYLTDHRLRAKAGGISFAPHSISLAEVPA